MGLYLAIKMGLRREHGFHFRVVNIQLKTSSKLDANQEAVIDESTIIALIYGDDI